MTPRKLTEADKQEILTLYRQPGETTSTLASRYGVSNSTISRILKTNLSETEYEALIQQKRSLRTAGNEPIDSQPEAPVEEAQLSISLVPAKTAKKDPSAKPSRKRGAIRTGKKVVEKSVEVEPAFPLPSVEEVEPSPELSSTEYEAEASAIQELLEKELFDQEELEEDLEDDLEEGLDEELDEELDESELGADINLIGGLHGEMLVQVLPLADAPLPKTCYLVVDRAAELIARPLKDFGELGQIPSDETMEKTLPIFDNHRVAKRFSNPRTQRVIKLPDSRMLQKTTSHLQAKGITRLLIDGQVYSLS